MKEKTKKDLILILYLIFGVIIVLLVSFLYDWNDKNLFNYDDECVKQVAKEFCKEYNCRVEKADRFEVEMRSYTTGDLMNAKILRPYLEICEV